MVKFSFLNLGAALWLGVVSAVNYWPIDTPSPTSPWVMGQPMSIVWGTGGGTGITSFDIQLHNANKSVMIGFIPLVQRVPMRKWTSGKRKGNWGGEIAVDLGEGTVNAGDGFSLVFMDTISGAVYSKSKKFNIYPAAGAPSNYTDADLPSGSPATTASVTAAPNPTQQWAITLDGTKEGVTLTSIQGGAGGNN